MANCSGTTPISPTAGCFSTCSPPMSYNQTNCGCTPCTAPVVVKGDVDNQVLVPVLADVIQNCMTISKCETGYPTDLLIETNLPYEGNGTYTPPTGTICITNVNYSYTCIGVEKDEVDDIEVITACNNTTLSYDSPSCTCGEVNLYNDFTTNITTPACCCNQVAQKYAQTKIVEKGVTLSACNLSIGVTGTIGGTPFTGNVVGTWESPAKAYTPLGSPTTLIGADTELGFPTTLNLCGIMCLPTSTKITISEDFDTCLTVDCIRPMYASYSTGQDVTRGFDEPPANICFPASADLSLIISKNIYATTSEKLAVITSSNGQIVCSQSAVPTCPQGTPCVNATPCPGPRQTV